MNLFGIYDAFLDLRENGFTKAGLERCIYHDTRDNQKIRPLVIIKSEHEYDEWMNKLQKWREAVEKLCDNDPARFNPNARLFKPEPVVIRDAYRVEIRESTATSQRKSDKNIFIRRMKTLLEAETMNAERTNDMSRVNLIKSQLDAMINDGETHYLVRSTGYKDVRLFVYMRNSKEPIKYNLSYVGAYIMPASDAAENFVSMPAQSVQNKTRKDKLDFSGIREVDHSLAMRGRLYPYSEYEKLKHSKTIEG